MHPHLLESELKKVRQTISSTLEDNKLKAMIREKESMLALSSLNAAVQGRKLEFRYV